MNHKTNITDNFSRGFTLAEMLIATAVLLIVSAAIFSLLFQSQDAYESQQGIIEITQQSRVATDQILRFLRQAGNDPEEIFAAQTPPAGHTHPGIYPIEILSAGPDWSIQINSDVTGSVAGATAIENTGDPDGNLNNLYETVTVRYNSATDELFMNIGFGEQLLAENVSGFNLQFFAEDGTEITTPASNEANIVRVKVQLTAQTQSTARTRIQSITLESDVFLRSKTFDVFA